MQEVSAQGLVQETVGPTYPFAGFLKLADQIKLITYQLVHFWP